MGAKENLELVERMRQAGQDQDTEAYAECVADDAVWRMAGVPAAMGGVTRGRQAIVELVGQGAGTGSFEVKDMFADDEHVCVIGKLHADRYLGNQHLQGADQPFSTYECIVYRIAGGKVAESTTYVNWLDPYVQLGLVDPSSFVR